MIIEVTSESNIRAIRVNVLTNRGIIVIFILRCRLFLCDSGLCDAE